ncbi:MAG: thioredoxin family protein [Syntrophobacteraceae bacterium]|nr:thioredoxin family protein [Syntrophobacteraceae bacterium]
MDVKVLGTGCTQCHTLTQVIMEVLTELKLPASVDHVMDIKEIARYGIMGSPALLINGKAVAVGSVPPRDRIKKWLTEASASAGGK